MEELRQNCQEKAEKAAAEAEAVQEGGTASTRSKRKRFSVTGEIGTDDLFLLQQLVNNWPAANDLVKTESVDDFVAEVIRSGGSRACICRLRRSAVKKVLEAQVRGPGGALSGGAACLNFHFCSLDSLDSTVLRLNKLF